MTVLFAAVRQRLFPKNSPKMEETDDSISKLMKSLALPTGYEGTRKKCPSNLNNYAALPV
jgi:hypothetical protein